MAGIQSERQIIEEYLKIHCIQECLDEVINDLIASRPLNPYVAITKMMETKTLAEIVDVNLCSTIVGGGNSGVLATVFTNVGSFSATVAYPYSHYDSAKCDMSTNYSNVQDVLRDALFSVDPIDLSEVDRILDTLSDLGDTISIAVSMACCRAGARHKGLPLYRYISMLMDGDEPPSSRIPLPVVAVLSRAKADDSYGVQTQDVVVFPLGALTFEKAMDTIQSFNKLLEKKIVDKVVDKSIVLARGDCGCIRVLLPAVDDAVKLVYGLFTEASTFGFKVGVDMRATDFAIVPTENILNDKITYNFQGVATVVAAPVKPPSAKGKKQAVIAPSPADAGVDADAQLLKSYSLWRETECVSIEDPIHLKDIFFLNALKTKINDAVTQFGEDPVTSVIGLEYSQAGVGGLEGCRIQIVSDAGLTTPFDIRNLMEAKSAVNAVKLRLDKVKTVTSVLNMCKSIRNTPLTLIVGYSESGPESVDTFIVDLSVGLGASQLMAGGITSGEHSAKYARLSEICKEDGSIPYVGKDFKR
mmetsp:Transcript_19734/g.19065  ORF Transcript_19734/g.19065 Transcript_19734/m.19065 type:complete len:529 (+) Transcript_19734:216-1802(+)|eukprot:CAMPEP_0119033484 /NCGR_PEP_ID=MMETSP1177-20130426/529_1 /TAXON_ID=2985 /ORGANISM="Ochromonas sp, Strain CCMP1899" /LENGTH=528 /DNA_ID=CAMNT_0006990257 /DNA_START=169 /DNA_END=1755 /DNA_ORIENTATION=+